MDRTSDFADFGKERIMTVFKENSAISKILSSNDTGETGGHQAGILVPKNPAILKFFPVLGNEEKNPRSILSFFDETGKRWDFAFIYYNNFLFEGTRNEYRLTRMTPFIRQNNLKAGDEIILKNDGGSVRLSILIRRLQSPGRNTGEPLRLGNTWKIIPI